jgi:Putative polyhydroxyalkanoic acid system protein (PHA_gran_rgn)
MASASKPTVITISHQLGRDNAKRRIDDGLGQIRRTLAPFASAIDYSWTGYRLDFEVTAMWHPIAGHIEVEDRLCRIELGLPVLLRALSGKIIGRIRSEGMQLLDRPADLTSGTPR